MRLTLTPLSDAGVTTLSPDIVWDGVRGDFALATTDDEGGIGSLRAANPLATAVLLCLMSDGPVEAYELRPEHRGDRRGWPGDLVILDAGEVPLGSKFWLYRRAVLNDATGMEIEAEAIRCLQPLVDQKAVVRIDAKATVNRRDGVVALAVNLYGRDGASAYATQFDLLWSRADGGL